MNILSQECGQMLKSTTVSKNTTMNLFLGQLNKRESRKEGNWKLVPLCLFLTGFSQCLKITEKVAFNIASEASCVYILSGQNFIQNAKNGQFGRIFEKCDFLRNFQTLW